MSKSNKLAKLSKAWGGKKIVKAAKKQGEKEGGLGKTGHKIIQTIGGIATGVMTKNLGRVNVPVLNVKVAPDEVVTGLGLAGMLFFKGGKKKWAEDALWAGINAISGRWTWTGQLVVIGDGKTVSVSQGPAEAKSEGDRDIKVKTKISTDGEGRTVVEGVEVESKSARAA